MALIVNAKGIKSYSIGVMSSDTPPVIVGGISSPGKIVVIGPPPKPHPPLRARAPNLPGKIHNYAEESGERVSVRPHPDDVARSIHEIQTRHLRPIYIAPARIHVGGEDSAVVVHARGWKAQPPSYPPKLGPTPAVVRPKSKKYPIPKPKPAVVLKGVVHGPGSLADEPVPPILPVEDITKRPIKTKIHDFTFGAHRTYKHTSV